MRVLALDVGGRRFGVAIGDVETGLAVPLTAFQRASEPQDIEAVRRLVDENDVQEIVVGLPLSLSGRMGPQAQEVSCFVEALRERVCVQVRTVDERYSTVEAERRLTEAGVKASRDRPRLDSAAATIILQSYLDSRRARGDV